MSSSGSSTFLRRVLWADAILSGVSGLAFALDAGALQGLLGGPTPLWRALGVSLFPFVALVVSVAWRPRPSSPAVWTVIGLNVAWVVGSVLLVTSGRFDLTTLGMAFVVGQAIAVAGVAELEYVGLRKAEAVAA